MSEIDGWPDKATTDPKAVERFWTDPITGWRTVRDVGIATGNGIVAIDIDVKAGDGEAMWAFLTDAYGGAPETWEQKTLSGGRHLLFRLPNGRKVGNSASRIAKHIDVRGERGFVKFYGTAAPPGPDDIADCPAWLLELLGEARATEGAGGVRHGAVLDAPDNIARAAGYLEQQAPAATTGVDASHTAFLVAATVKDFGISEPCATDLMLEHWNERNYPPLTPDDLQHRVSNAYRYGREPVGLLDPAADFPVPAVTGGSSPETDFPPPGEHAISVARHKLHFVFGADITVSRKATYLIKGFLDQGAMSVIYGPSNSGKSFVALDIGWHIATGRQWRRRRTRSGLVVYVAAEGGGGFSKRIAALRMRHGDDGGTNLAIVPCSVDLLADDGDLRALTDLVRQAEVESGQKAALVVIDTLSRAMGGGNENAPEDMTKFIRHLDALRQHTAAHVLIVHHSGKDAARGARGHSSLRAATDTEIEVSGEARSFQVTKQRDMDIEGAYGFDLEAVEVARDEDDDAIVSCVVLESEVTAKQRAPLKAGSIESKLYRLVIELTGKKGVPAPAELGLPGGIHCIEMSTLREGFCDISGNWEASTRQAYKRGRDKLLESGWVHNMHDLLWVMPDA